MATFALGGLTDVGFAESSDLLLALSSAGRGLFECRQGILLARDEAEDFNFDTGNLLCAGIGPLARERVRMSGLYGGGLASHTADGWSIERQPLSWPDDELILAPPGQSMLWSPRGKPVDLTKLGGFIAELRAFGFSPTGHSLIVATAADITVFGRTAAPANDNWDRSARN